MSTVTKPVQTPSRPGYLPEQVEKLWIVCVRVNLQNSSAYCGEERSYLF
jgi:hypothetical protein